MAKPKKIIYYLILGMIMINTCGCWDSRGLETLSFPLAGGYDLHKESVETEKTGAAQLPLVDVTTVIPNLSLDSEEKIRVETVSGPSVSIARRYPSLSSEDTYFPGMVQVVILGEDLAKQGLEEHLDSLIRLSVLKGDVSLAVAAGRAEDILKTEIKENENIAFFLSALLKDINKTNYIPATSIFEYFRSLSVGRNPVMPVLKKDEEKITIIGAAIFRKDTMITKIDFNQARSLVFLRGLKSQGHLSYRLKENDEKNQQGTVLVKNSRKVKVKREGEKFKINIQVNLQGILEERDKNVLINNIKSKDLREIETVIAKNVENDLKKFIMQMQQEWKVDCIDISRFVLAKDRKIMTPVIDSSFIEDAEIEVEVKVHLKNTGEAE